MPFASNQRGEKGWVETPERTLAASDGQFQAEREGNSTAFLVVSGIQRQVAQLGRV
jgi:hypothetical protein